MAEKNANSKATQRDEARKKAQALKVAQERREKRTRLIIIATAILGLVVVGLLVKIILGNEKPEISNAKDLSGVENVPSVVGEDGGIRFGKELVAGTDNGDVPEVAVYFDYLCNNCANFEAQNGPDLEAAAQAGEITLVFHPVAIMEPIPYGSGVSTRASAAFTYIAENAPENALAFHEALMAQKIFNSTTAQRFTDQQITDLAIAQGVPEDVAKAAVSGKYEDYVTAGTGMATGNADLKNSSGSFGTPTVVIDGKKFTQNWATEGVLMGAVNAVTGK